MPDTWRDEIRTNFRFADLPDVDRGPEFVHVIGYRPPWHRLPEFRGVEIRKNLVLPSLIDSREAYVTLGHDATDRLIVSFGEAGTAEQTREGLVDLLGAMMITDMRRISELQLQLGDDGFVGPGAEPDPIMFTCANETIYVQSERGHAGWVLQVANIIHTDLVSIPVATSNEDPPIIEEVNLAATEVAVGTVLPFTFRYHDREGSALHARIWTTAGPVQREDGKLRLLARQRGDHPLRIMLVTEDGRVARAETTVLVT